MSEINKALIITGGAIDLDFLRSYYKRNQGSYIVGVDGGCSTALEAEVPMDLIYGDFDTLDAKKRDCLFDSGIEHKVLDPEKDLTDTHGAIEELIGKNYQEITILGGFGTRIDHTFANLMVPFQYIKECKITYIDRYNKIRFYEGPIEVRGVASTYKYISLIPVTETCITQTSGLKYNLYDAKLSPYNSLGVSNEIEGDYYIGISKGKLLITQSDDEPQKI